ncbi:MAG: sigma-70 family RNA polymerase sigma factor [Deltaproteobacteria bacterium]|nr:sigma-70 family RNA polymerase sigma factor [Deltaproteobacteria bacterium]
MSLPVLSDNLQSYLAEVNRYPVLSQADEFKVAERFYNEKKLEDAHILVTSNLRYVIKIALEFRNYGCRLADLIQEGNIGLMIAVKKFNPYKGFRLITYATMWIKSCIQDYILKTKGIVKRNAKALKRQLFYKKGDGAAVIDINDESTSAATSSEDFGFSNDFSLDRSLSESDDKATHLDMLADSGPTPIEVVAIKQETAIAKREVTNALAVLNEKERIVIENRVMADEPESLQGLGNKLGLTRERVRQIESEALKKLRKSLGKKMEMFGPIPELA